MARKGGRRAFGWALAQLRREPGRARAILRELLPDDTEFRRRLVRVMRCAELHSGEADARTSPRATTSTPGARLLAVVLALLQETSQRNWRAGGTVWTWQGGHRRRQRVRGGAVVLRESVARGGLSARAGVSARQLQRYLRVLEQGQVLRRWQPPSDGADHAGRYAVYEWATIQRACIVPLSIRRRLREWSHSASAAVAAALEEPRRQPRDASSAVDFWALVPPEARPGPG